MIKFQSGVDTMTKKRTHNQARRTFRIIPFEQLPRELQPLAIKISKLEKALLTTKNAVDMNFDHLFGLLVDLKKTSMDMIQQAKMLEKIRKEKDGK